MRKSFVSIYIYTPKNKGVLGVIESNSCDRVVQSLIFLYICVYTRLCFVLSYILLPNVCVRVFPSYFRRPRTLVSARPSLATIPLVIFGYMCACPTVGGGVGCRCVYK